MRTGRGQGKQGNSEGLGGEVVIRLAEVVACRRRKQAKRVSEEESCYMGDGAQ